MYLNELDNFHFDLPDRGHVAGGAPQIGGLSSADQCLFRKVVEKYFAEDLQSGQSAPASASSSDDAQLPAFDSQLSTDNGFGIGIGYGIGFGWNAGG